MKAIPESAYKNLTMTQRLNAAIAAFGRDDTDELQRLSNIKDTGYYTIDKLNARLRDIHTMTMAINLELMSCLTNWLLAQTVDSQDPPDLFAMAGQIIKQSFIKCSSIITARNQWLVSQGISLEDYERFNSATPSMLGELIKRAEGKEDDAHISVYFYQIHSYFKGRYPS